MFPLILQAIEPVVSVLKRKGTTEENWASFLEKIPRFEKELVRRKTAFFRGTPAFSFTGAGREEIE